jgi:peroxiredoxin
MNYILIFGLIIGLAAIAACCSLGWQLLQQNGRLLLRMEALEKRIERKVESRKQNAETHQSLVPSTLRSAATEDGSIPTGDEDERAERFGNRSLANSKIQRDGLKAGTVAPEFRLPRLNGGELSLSELRGRLVLLVFSSPHCGPCNVLAPKLEKFHRKCPELELVVISQGDADENHQKVKEHGLTFPVVLQKQWEVSRDYAFFATPVSYLIDRNGLILEDVAVGVDAVLDLMKRAKRMLRHDGRTAKPPLLRRVALWIPSPTSGARHKARAS